MARNLLAGTLSVEDAENLDAIAGGEPAATGEVEPGAVDVTEVIEQSSVEEELDGEVAAITEDAASIEEMEDATENLEEVAEQNEEKIEQAEAGTAEVTPEDVTASNEELRLSVYRLTGSVAAGKEVLAGMSFPSVESAGGSKEALILSTEAIKEFAAQLVEKIKEMFAKVFAAIKKVGVKLALYFTAYVNNAKGLGEKAKALTENAAKGGFENDTTAGLKKALSGYAVVNGLTKIDGKAIKNVGVLGVDGKTFAAGFKETIAAIDSVVGEWAGKGAEEFEGAVEKIGEKLKANKAFKTIGSVAGLDKVADGDTDAVAAIVRCDGASVQFIKVASKEGEKVRPAAVSYQVSADAMGKLEFVPANKTDIIAATAEMIKSDAGIKTLMGELNASFKTFDGMIAKLGNTKTKGAEDKDVPAAKEAVSYLSALVRSFGVTYLLGYVMGVNKLRSGSMRYLNASYKLIAGGAKEGEKK